MVITKISLAALAAGLLISNAAADIDMDSFVSQMSSLKSPQKYNTVPAAEILKPKAAVVTDVCSEITEASRSPNLSEASAIRLIADIIETKVRSGALKNLDLKNRSNSKAREWIDSKINKNEITDHFSINYTTVGTADFFVATWEFLNAFDYNAKNREDLAQEIIRRNVLFHVYFSQEYPYQKPKKDTSNISKEESIKAYFEKSGEDVNDTDPAFYYSEAFKIDTCKEANKNVLQFGPNDMWTAYVLTQVSVPYNGVKNGHIRILLNSRAGKTLFDGLLNRQILKWKSDRQSHSAMMFDSIMDELKKRKIAK